MTTAIISGYSSGYTIPGGVSTLSIAASGYVGGTGISVNGVRSDALTIVNQGAIDTANGADPGSRGIDAPSNNQFPYKTYLTNGSLTNTAALIEGGGGAYLGGGAVYNFGSIISDSRDAVGLSSDGAIITNGANADTHALIEGGTALFADGTPDITNYGEIIGTQTVVSFQQFTIAASGVEADFGGRLTNGSAADTTAQTRGYRGVYFGSYGAAGTVVNFGTIASTPWFANGTGIDMTLGGSVVNGSTADEAALIAGTGLAVEVKGGAGAISNFGTIQITPGAAGDNAVALYSGGSVNNGATGDHAALIQGVNAVTASGGVTKVSNFGDIRGSGFYNAVGVSLGGGGSVTNGASTDTGATIYGYARGVVIAGGAGTVVNDGSILSTYYIDVNLYGGGRLTNGSTSLKSALIEGGGGLLVAEAAATISNFGTIAGEHAGDWGAQLDSAGSRLTNGSASDPTALISGYNGLYAGAGVTVTNFGRISGDTALELAASTSELLAEAGSTLGGVVLNAGRLDVVGGVATVSGGLVNSGAVVGAGTLALIGGTSQFNAGSALSVAKIAVSGAGTAADFNANVADGKIWTQTAGTIAIAAGDKATFSGTGDSFSGVTFTGAGGLAFTTKVTFSGVTTLSVPVINTGTLTIASGTLTVIGALTGAGTIAIGPGVADITSTFTENVTFTSATGVLELAMSQSYTGTIAGFSTTGTNSLDLGDIAFGAGTKATYSGTTTSGTLTVTDGTHTAKIKLSGNYTTSTFTVSSDGHGGTKVVDPSAPATHAPSSPLVFIDAMAGLGARSGALADIAIPPRQHPMLSLVRSQVS